NHLRINTPESKKRSSPVLSPRLPEENKTADPELAKQTDPLKLNPEYVIDHPQLISAQENTVQRKEAVSSSLQPDISKLSQVFSDEDLQELGVTPKNKHASEKGVWDLASHAAEKLSEVTGKEI